MSIISTALRRRERSDNARFARTGFAESTLAELAWQSARSATGRWGVAGAVVGALAALAIYAPAAWLASALSSATGDRLLLTDARGSVWYGSALPVLTGGPGSRDASALPGRVEWKLALHGLAVELRARQSCCLRGELRALIRPGFGRLSVQLLPAESNTVGQWPASWLVGLGTPWNTLQLGGTLRLTSTGLTVEWVQGRTRFTGDVERSFAGASSRIATLDTLGSYRLSVHGNAASGDAASVSLTTIDGALRLSGQGEWTANGLRFRGEAQAAEGSETALNNLLNIIGRRQGARSVISIG